MNSFVHPLTRPRRARSDCPNLTISLPLPGTRFINLRKRKFNRRQIVVDVGMIEFDVVDDRDFRQVVHKLRTFVEISGVVFVAFDDEVVAVGHSKTDAEVLRDAADQKGRIESALIHHPRRDARRRRFAVRAGDDQRAPAANKFFLDDFGLRAIESLRLSVSSTSGFPRGIALPTITQSGAGVEMFSAL